VPFEEAIIDRLREVTVADVKGENVAAQKVETLAGQLAELDGLVKAWEAKMDDPRIVDTVAAKLAELNDKRRKLAEKLADAQREESCPLSESWGEARGLLDLYRNDKSDETRIKLRGALRRAITSVTCLFTGKDRVRIAVVRVQFKSGNIHRDYAIGYDPGRSNGRVQRPGSWAVRDFKGWGKSAAKVEREALAIAG
jgi:hypothetical protein